MPRNYLKYLYLIVFVLVAVFISFNQVGIVESQTSTPLPTPRRPRAPLWQPVNPAYVPCRVTNNEFHPLRPYPANACDPLIPRKLPEAINDIPDKLYMTFQCGKAAVPQGLYDTKDVVVVCDMDTLPSDWNSIPLRHEGGTRSDDFRCVDGGTEICFVKQITVGVALRYQDTQFPIIGNVQNYLTDTQKINGYLSWYLSGTVLQSDHIRLDSDEEDDINRLVNFSGPVKKLLSFDSQSTIQRTLQRSPPLNSDYHNYIVDPGRVSGASPYNPNIPLSSLEDITGEVMVAIEPARQPRMPEIDGVIFRIGLGIGAADSRLYFPHLKETNVLTQFLTSTYRPYPIFITPTTTPLPRPIYTYADDSSLIGQRITYHQGPYPPVPGGTGDPALVQTQTINGQVVRNTEVMEGRPAPSPLYIAPDIYCDLTPVRTNPGDDLVGRTINTTLVYRQLFRYSPQLVIDCPCSSSNATTSCISYGLGENCFALEGDECNQSSRQCCWGSCPPEEPPECYRFNYGTGSSICDYPQYACSNTSCNTYCCAWTEPPPPTCPTWPMVGLRSKAIISTYTKTPMVDRLYELLVNSPQSLLNRFMPGKSQNGDMTIVPPPNVAPEGAIPGAAAAQYTGSTNDLREFRVDGGNGGGGGIYFPRIGSLMDHILGSGARNQNKNLQCLFWPYGRCKQVTLTAFCDGSRFAEIYPNPTPVSGFGQSYFESYIIPLITPQHIEAYVAAQEETGVPCEVLAGIHWMEGGLEMGRSLQDGGLLNGRSLTESAIAAAHELLTKACDNVTGAECEINDLETLAMALTRYNGGSNRNCQNTSNCAPDHGFPDLCGTTTACSSAAPSNCVCNRLNGQLYIDPNSCRGICGYGFNGGTFPYEFSYGGTCPPPYEGYDDPYVTNFWTSPDHDQMYLLFLRDCTASRPFVFQRLGILPTAIALFLSGSGTTPP